MPRFPEQAQGWPEPEDERERLLASERVARAEAEALADLMRQAATEPDAERTCSLVVEYARPLVGADYAGIVTYDAEGEGDWRAMSGNHTDAWLHANGRARRGTARQGTGLSRRSLDAGETIVVERLGDEPGVHASRTHVAEGARTVLAAPVRGGERIVASLALGWRTDVSPSREQVRLAETLAHYVGSVLDAALIREQRQRTEMALREAGERLLLVTRATNDAVWDWDLGTDAVQWNEGVRTLFGYEPSQVEPDAAWRNEHIHPEDAERVDRGIHTVIDGGIGTTWVDEYRYRRVDGSYAEVLDRGYVMRDAAGRAVRMVGAMQDITANKVAERQLRGQAALLDLSTAAIITGGFVDGRITFWNKGAERLYGWAREEAIGRELGEFLRVEFPRPLEELKADLEREGRWEGEIVQYTRDGRRLVVASRWSLQIDWRGAPDLFLVVNRDITGQREREAQERQAEQLRALGELTSGVAHDLNQSLALIAGYADLMAGALRPSAPDLAGAQEMLRIVQQAALDGGETVNRLLAFSRGREDSAAERLEVGALLREVAALTAPRWRDAARAEGQSISLHVEAAEDLWVEGRPAALREALTNLVFNAVDALPAGGAVRLAARGAGAHVLIEVSDTGVGMGREVQARALDPFFTTKGERGSGLGLALVFGIVEQHRGGVRITSQPGQGTTVSLSLPAVPAESEPPGGAITGAVAGPSSVPGLRVLAVDDEPNLARMAALMLRALGHTVDVAHSGEEALERLAAEPHDAVVSDLGMGVGMSGWDLAEQARRHWPALRFVLVTGWGAQINPEEARRRGVDAVVAKPYRSGELEQAVAPAASTKTP